MVILTKKSTGTFFFYAYAVILPVATMTLLTQRPVTTG